jgi:hypothetical protein
MGYSFLGGTQSNGGDRLYIGTGTETNGVAANIAVIGGKYYTDKLSHVPGTVTANSAIITDANNKIDILNVDNITINDNTITATNINGSIVLAANGTGTVSVSSKRITDLATPTANTDATTKAYVDTVALNAIIPSTQVSDFAEAVQDTVGGMLTGTQNGITVTYTDGGVGAGVLNFDVADPTITLSGDVTGSATMTNLGNVTITTTIAANSVALGTDTTGDYVASLVAGTGVTLTNNSGESATPTIAIGQNVSPTSNVQFNYGLFNGDLTIDGNFIVGGTTTTISAQNLSISDNMIYLNQGILATITNAVGNGANVVYTTTTNNYQVGFNVTVTGMTPSSFNVNSTGAPIIAANSTSFTIASTVTDTFVSGGTARGKTNANPDLGWAGGYNDGTYAHAGFFRDATDGVFKVFKNYTPEPDDSVFIDTAHASFALADMRANNFIGTLQGIANTALALNTARTIALSGDVAGSVSFDGSANVTITTTIQADSIALGTDTTGNYVADVSVTSGTGLSITGTGEGASVVLAGINANNTVKGVASFDANNFTVSSGAVSINSIDGGTY